MRTAARTLVASPMARLGAYGLVLALVLGGGALVGAAVGPEPSAPPAHDGHDRDAPSGGDPHAGHDRDAAAPSAPAGVSVAQDGYHLQFDTPTVPAGTPAELRFVIHGPDGAAVTAYDVAHEQELHLVVVSRDLATYAHLHPARDETGTWSIVGPALPPGSYRVYTDFVPAGGAGVTLAADLAVPGEHSPAALVPSTTDDVDGFEVTFAGELVPGRTSELTVTVSRDGQPVTDLEPYLGALGHLVAIRDGDLAYLHVHPLGGGGTGGPGVRFAVAVPSAGAYGLYFDFSHGGTVRTASVIVTPGVTTGAPDASAPAPHAGHTHGAGDDHAHGS